MADRRIDQLTEAEDISDEDLFVIWKKNISQTRSIAKGTMNLATKQDVIMSRKLDWQNAVEITYAQLNTGYVCPEDGMIVGWGYESSVDGTYKITINDVEVASYWRATPSYSFMNIQCPVNKDNLVKSTRVLNNGKVSFVPYEVLGE